MNGAEIDTMVPAREAAEVAGISPQLLRYWEQSQLISPTVSRRLSERRIVRLYALDALLELLVAAALRREPGISVQHIRKTITHLRERGGYEAPLRELVYGVVGDEIVFQHPDGTWEGSRRPGHLIIRHVLPIQEMRDRITALLSEGRSREDLGRVERIRGGMGSKPVFAGTRTPVQAVVAFLHAGADDQEILDAYPSLVPADIEVARREAG